MTRNAFALTGILKSNKFSYTIRKLLWDDELQLKSVEPSND